MNEEWLESLRKDGYEDILENTFTGTIRIPRSEFRVAYEPYPLPEPTSHWKTVLLVNGVIIGIFFAVYFYLRWRNRQTDV